MKVYLLVFTPFLLSVSESSLSIQDGGIAQELLGEKKQQTEVVETPQFQKEVFVPITEVADEEQPKDLDQQIAKEAQDSKDEIIEKEVSSKKIEGPENLEKKEVVENPEERGEHQEETASQDEKLSLIHISEPTRPY